MSIGNSVGNARWTQGEEDEEAIELRVPIVLPPSVRPRDLTVEVKDLAVLCVRHKDTSILQWRLYEAVSEEVEWRVEDEGVLVLDLTKKRPARWPCLLDLPMRADDDLFASLEELDRLCCAHHPPLPADVDPALRKSVEREEEEEKTATKENKDGAGGGDMDGEEDLDKLLDEAAEEVVGTPAKDDVGDSDAMRDILKKELHNYRIEEEEIRKNLLEVAATLEAGGEGDSVKQAEERKNVLDEMLRLLNTIRELRTQPSSLARFLEVTELEIRKARVNVGEMSENENEEYANDEERGMSAEQLMSAGLQLIEQQMQSALHLLRLAAIHHNHEESLIILYSIYSQLGSPRGPFMLFKRALKDDAPSAVANLRLGEMFDIGSRYFFPSFPAALFFYQRAAKAGSVQAMLAIAQMYLRGSTSRAIIPEETPSLRSVEKYHAWLQQAADRGSGSAYFVQASMHLRGDHGCAKSYKMAKELLEKATSSEPEITRRAPQVYMMLEKLRQEEEGGGEKKTISTPLTLAKAKEAAAAAATTAAAAEQSGNDDGDGHVHVSSSLERLNKIAPKNTATGGGMLRSKKTASGGGGASAKAFWEKAVTTGIALYSLYTVAFPLRILALPHFYTVISQFIDRIPWLSASPPPMQF